LFEPDSVGGEKGGKRSIRLDDGFHRVAITSLLRKQKSKERVTQGDQDLSDKQRNPRDDRCLHRRRNLGALTQSFLFKKEEE